MPLWMCIQHVKVRLVYTNREILSTLKNGPTNYCLAHSVFLFHCKCGLSVHFKCVSSFYTEGFNTGQGGAHLRDGHRWRHEARVIRGRLRRRWGRHGGTVGWGWGASSLVLLSPWWCSGSGVDEGDMAVVSKRSWHGGGSSGEGVLARRQRQRGPTFIL
jgi:hypothetical protein